MGTGIVMFFDTWPEIIQISWKIRLSYYFIPQEVIANHKLVKP